MLAGRSYRRFWHFFSLIHYQQKDWDIKFQTQDIDWGVYLIPQSWIWPAGSINFLQSLPATGYGSHIPPSTLNSLAKLLVYLLRIVFVLLNVLISPWFWYIYYNQTVSTCILLVNLIRGSRCACTETGWHCPLSQNSSLIPLITILRSMAVFHFSAGAHC